MLVWILQVSEGLIIKLHVHVGTICNLKEYLKKVVMLITILFIFSYFVIWIANTKANFLWNISGCAWWNSYTYTGNRVFKRKQKILDLMCIWLLSKVPFTSHFYYIYLSVWLTSNILVYTINYYVHHIFIYLFTFQWISPSVHWWKCMWTFPRVSMLVLSSPV